MLAAGARSASAMSTRLLNNGFKCSFLNLFFTCFILHNDVCVSSLQCTSVLIKWHEWCISMAPETAEASSRPRLTPQCRRSRPIAWLAWGKDCTRDLRRADCQTLLQKKMISALKGFIHRDRPRVTVPRSSFTLLSLFFKSKRQSYLYAYQSVWLHTAEVGFTQENMFIQWS